MTPWHACLAASKLAHCAPPVLMASSTFCTANVQPAPYSQMSGCRVAVHMLACICMQPAASPAALSTGSCLARTMPLVVMATCRKPSLRMALSSCRMSTRSFRSVGSPPVSRILVTPACTKVRACEHGPHTTLPMQGAGIQTCKPNPTRALMPGHPHMACPCLQHWAWACMCTCGACVRFLHDMHCMLPWRMVRSVTCHAQKRRPPLQLYAQMPAALPPHQSHHLLCTQQLLPACQLNTLSRHAVGAAQVAALCQ